MSLLILLFNYIWKFMCRFFFDILRIQELIKNKKIFLSTLFCL